MRSLLVSFTILTLSAAYLLLRVTEKQALDTGLPREHLSFVQDEAGMMTQSTVANGQTSWQESLPPYDREATIKSEAELQDEEEYRQYFSERRLIEESTPAEDHQFFDLTDSFEAQ